MDIKSAFTFSLTAAHDFVLFVDKTLSITA